MRLSESKDADAPFLFRMSSLSSRPHSALSASTLLLKRIANVEHAIS